MAINACGVRTVSLNFVRPRYGLWKGRTLVDFEELQKLFEENGIDLEVVKNDE